MRIQLLRGRSTLVALSVLVAMVGCGGTESEEVDAISEETGVTADSDEVEAKADRPALALTVVPGIGNPGSTAVRRTFTTRAAYMAFFGKAPPTSIDFTREWAVFYGAGTKPTGGYKASVESVRLSDDGTILRVTSALTSPGAGCAVTLALTSPAVLVKFTRPTLRTVTVRYYTHDTQAPACGPVSPCSLVRCAAGTSCIVTSGIAQCVSTTGRCLSDVDCVLHDNYCGGCQCQALGRTERPVMCTNPVVCFAQPCAGHVARCDVASGRCLLQ